MTPDEFWQILHDVPDSKPIYYRLYYDDSGRPICYSMEDLPGNYIEIDQSTYIHSSMWIKVKDGKLQEYRPWLQPAKLTPSGSGVPCDPCDIMIVNPANNAQTWSMENHDQD